MPKDLSRSRVFRHSISLYKVPCQAASTNSLVARRPAGLVEVCRAPPEWLRASTERRHGLARLGAGEQGLVNRAGSFIMTPWSPPGGHDNLAPGRGAAWIACLTGGQEVAGSNPAAPTCLNRKPFSQKTERLSLFYGESYVGDSPVQRKCPEEPLFRLLI